MNLEYSGDNSRLKAEMQSVTFTPIEKSAEILYHWYQQNKSKLDINKLLVDK